MGELASSGPRMRRRRFVSTGVVAAAAVTGVPGLLTGCAAGSTGSASAGAPAPQPAQPVTTLIIQPWRFDGGKVLQSVMGANLAGFEAQHPGVRVVMTVGEAPSIAALLAGDAPDVIQANDEMPYVAGAFILPLDAYLKKDNVDPAIWPALQIDASRWGGKLHGLPSYFNMVVMMANHTAFDEVGLAYPSPDWTAAEFVKVAAAMTTTKGGKKRYGAALLWTYGGPTDMEYVLEGFGGGLMDATDTVCRLGDPGSVAAGEWVYQQLLWPGIATEQDVLAAVVTGNAAVGPARPDQLVFDTNLVARSSGFKWDFLPMPRFPHGRATNAPAQYYMINAGSKSPDLAWELVKWISVEPSWQQMMMRLALIPPSLISLQAEWEAVVLSVVPPLKGKSLKWFGDALQQNYAYPYRHFAYSDSQATKLMGGYTQQLAARKTDVPLAFAQAAQQVNAQERIGTQTLMAQASMSKEFPAVGPMIASVQPGL